MSGISRSSADSGQAEGLAGVSPADEVDGLNLAPIHRCHVAEIGHQRPVFGENPGSVGVGLALPHDLHAGALEPEVEPPDAGEQRADLHDTRLASQISRTLASSLNGRPHLPHWNVSNQEMRSMISTAQSQYSDWWRRLKQDMHWSAPHAFGLPHVHDICTTALA